MLFFVALLLGSVFTINENCIHSGEHPIGCWLTLYSQGGNYQRSCGY